MAIGSKAFKQVKKNPKVRKALEEQGFGSNAVKIKNDPEVKKRQAQAKALRSKIKSARIGASSSLGNTAIKSTVKKSAVGNSSIKDIKQNAVGNNAVKSVAKRTAPSNKSIIAKSVQNNASAIKNTVMKEGKAVKPSSVKDIKMAQMEGERQRANKMLKGAKSINEGGKAIKEQARKNEVDRSERTYKTLKGTALTSEAGYKTSMDLMEKLVTPASVQAHGNYIHVENGKVKRGLSKEEQKRSQKDLKNIDKDIEKQQKKQAKGEKLKAEAKKGLGKAGISLDLLSTGAEMLPDIAVGQINPALFWTSLAGRVYGQSYNTAKMNGATDKQANLSATMNVVTEGLTERLFSVPSIMTKATGKGLIKIGKKEGTEYLNKGLNKLIKSDAGKDVLYALKRLGLASSTEGAEEVIAGIVQPVLDNAIYMREQGEEINKEWWKDTLKESAYSGLLGAILGGTMGGADINNSLRRSESNRAKAEREAYTRDFMDALKERARSERGLGAENVRTARERAENLAVEEAPVVEKTPERRARVQEADAIEPLSQYERTTEEPTEEPAKENKVATPEEEEYNTAEETTERRTENGRREEDNMGEPSGEVEGLPDTNENNQITNETGNLDTRSGSRVSRNILTQAQDSLFKRNNVADSNVRDYSEEKSFFVDSIANNASSQPYGVSVDIPTEEDLNERGAKTFATEDGTATIAVDRDGDIIALSKHADSPNAGVTEELLLTALANGGTKMDAYGQFLAQTYANYGFVPVARIPFDPQYIESEEAKATFRELAEKQGYEGKEGPDVYVFAHNGDNLRTVLQKNRNDEYKEWTKEDLDNLPEMEYDEALEYRDNLMNDVPMPEVGTTNSQYNNAVERAQENFDESIGELVPPERSPRERSDEQIREEIDSARRNGVMEYGTPRVVKDSEIQQAVDGILNRDVSEQFNLEVMNAILNGGFNKNRYKIADTVDEAIEAVNKNPADEIKKILELRDSDVIPKDSYKTMAKGEYILRLLSQNENNAELYKDVAEALSEVASVAGGALRASQLLRLTTPAGRLRNVEKLIARLQYEYRKKLKGREITLSDETKRRILEADTEENLNTILKEAELEIWNQVPATLKEKWDAIRMLAMLGNPKTHIRNMVGNAIFVPVRAVKNALGVATEGVAQGVGAIDQTDRTKAFLNAGDRELINLGARIFEANKEAIRGESRFINEATNRPMEGDTFTAGGRTNPVLRLLDKVAQFNGKQLDTEDIWFMRPAFSHAFARIMKARGLTPNDVRLNPELESEITALSAEEALRAVYRDASKLATWINTLKKQHGAVGMITDSIMPFVKTPINIMRRSIDYSPVGLLYSISQIYKAGRKLSSADNADEQLEAKRELVTQLDRLSAGMTGTMITGVGYLLASLGMIQGDVGDDDEAYYRKDLGAQSFSIKLPNGGSYTVDWAVPASIPLFTGASIWDYAKDGNFSLGQVLDVLGKTLDPTMEMSVLQGVSQLFDSTQTGTAGDRIINLGTDITANYFGQAIPTISGQIARTIDPVRRSTTSTAESGVQRQIERFLRRQQAKIPVASKGLEPMLDKWGDEKTTGGGLRRFVENFLSPGYYQSGKATKVDKEILRLLEATGNSEVIPKGLKGYTLTLKGDEQRLSEKNLTTHDRAKGQQAKRDLERLINSAEYKSMSDAERLDAIEKVYKSARTTAKQKTLIEMGNDAWEVYSADLRGKRKPNYADAKEAGFTPKQYYDYVTSKDWDANGNGYISNYELKSWLNGLDLSGEKKAVLFDKMKYNKNTYNPYGKGVETADAGSSSGGYRRGRRRSYGGRRRSGGGSSRRSAKTDSEKAFTRATSARLRNNISQVRAGATNLSTAQKKALLKVLNAKLS